LHKEKAARKPPKFVWFVLNQSSIAAIAIAVKQMPDTPIVNKVIKPKAKIKSFMIISRDFKKRGPMILFPSRKWGGPKAAP
jgi:hypothetical protein